MAETIEGVEVRRLRLKPGDHIILRTDVPISREQADKIKRDAEERWPGHPVTVLDRLEIDVLADPT